MPLTCDERAELSARIAEFRARAERLRDRAAHAPAAWERDLADARRRVLLKLIDTLEHELGDE